MINLNYLAQNPNFLQDIIVYQLQNPTTNHNKIHPEFTKILKTGIQNIKNPIYSEHNMVNLSDILYFFSNDMDKQRLINVFSEKKSNQNSISATAQNNLLKLVKHIDTKTCSSHNKEKKSRAGTINRPHRIIA